MIDDESHSPIEAVERIERHDATLKCIWVTDRRFRVGAVYQPLIDCLVSHPNAVERVSWACFAFTDHEGVMFAQYIAASNTLQKLALMSDHFGDETYLAMAAALRVNTSLVELSIRCPTTNLNSVKIDAAFVDAFRLNPRRSQLYLALYSCVSEYPRLKHAAEQLGHPTLQMLLQASAPVSE